jgi:hypothetical protein
MAGAGGKSTPESALCHKPQSRSRALYGLILSWDRAATAAYSEHLEIT